MDTTEEKMIELIPCKLFDACLRALSLADATVRTGSSRTCSLLIDGNNPFLRLHYTRLFPDSRFCFLYSKILPVTKMI